MNSPITYAQQQFINYFNMQPSVVKGSANYATEYYKRKLWRLIYSVYKFNLPDTWADNFFRFFLFHCGSIAVIYTREFGWVCQPYSIAQIDLYYNPKIIEVNNQMFSETKTGIIGVNASIIKIFDDYYGLDDVVSRYAEKLASCDKSIDINLMNANVSLVCEVENKKQADEINEAYGQATTGKPLVAINKKILQGKQLTTLISSPSSTFIADKVQTLKRAIVNEFLTEVGIKNANYEKKERLNSQEVGENDDETRAMVEIILENINKGFDEVRKVTAGACAPTVEMRFNYEKEVESNANDIVRNAPVQS